MMDLQHCEIVLARPIRETWDDAQEDSFPDFSEKQGHHVFKEALECEPSYRGLVGHRKCSKHIIALAS
jgi:hypothetical protein